MIFIDLINFLIQTNNLLLTGTIFIIHLIKFHGLLVDLLIEINFIGFIFINLFKQIFNIFF